MDPLRIIVRCLVAYLFLLFMLRIAGKRTLHEGTAFEFVLALVVGDLVDDVIWSEVPVAQFAVATATLVFTKLGVTMHKLRISRT
jgi:uncharacterized membrane protein YcaP (DUF421 family)